MLVVLLVMLVFRERKCLVSVDHYYRCFSLGLVYTELQVRQVNLREEKRDEL